MGQICLHINIEDQQTVPIVIVRSSVKGLYVAWFPLLTLDLVSFVTMPVIR